jgi:hypothetical protein
MSVSTPAPFLGLKKSDLQAIPARAVARSFSRTAIE